MQNSSWLRRCSEAPCWKAAPAPSLLVDPFRTQFLSEKQIRSWSCVGARPEAERTQFEEPCVSRLHHNLLPDTVGSADTASAPSHLALSQTIAHHYRVLQGQTAIYHLLVMQNHGSGR